VLHVLADSASDDPGVANLEKRAAELTSRRARASVLGSTMERLAVERELNDVLSRLSAVHPTSGYLYFVQRGLGCTYFCRLSGFTHSSAFDPRAIQPFTRTRVRPFVYTAKVRR
jgi:hypothetical protein